MDIGAEGPEVGADWEKLPGTPAGAYYRIAPDVIVAVPKRGYRQTEEDARRSLAALDAIAADTGRKVCVIVLVDRVASQNAGARRSWSAPRANECRCGTALVTSTLLARAIGSFFLGLSKGPVTMRMFPDLDTAYAWAKQMVEVHGGPL